MSRRVRLVLIAAGVVVFLGVSVLLARFLSVENVERDADLRLLVAQAAGDGPAMLAQLSGCAGRPSCRAVVAADARSLRRRGPVKILDLQSSTAYSLVGATGSTRVAWTVIGQLPVVQCLRLRRSGDVLTGVSVTLLAVSPRISSTGVC